MFKILIFLSCASLIQSRIITVTNNAYNDLIVSMTGFEDFILQVDATTNAIEVEDSWEGFVFARHPSCNVTDCSKYTTKAHFQLGYLADNLDKIYVDVRDAYNYGVIIKSSPASCLQPKCQDSFFLSQCYDSNSFIVNRKLYACLNTKDIISKFNVKCGQTAVTTDDKEETNTYRCANVEKYIVVIGDR